MKNLILNYVLFISLVFNQTIRAEERFIILQDTKINQSIFSSEDGSFKDYWFKIRKMYKQKDQNFVDSWVLTNPIAKMPKTQLVKLDEKNDSIRLLITKDAKTSSIEFNSKKENLVNINGLTIENKNTQSLELLNKLLVEGNKDGDFGRIDLTQAPLQIERNLFSKLDQDEKIIFFLQKRTMFELANEILKKNKKTYSGYLPILFDVLVEATYAAVESKCLSKGGLLSLTEKGKCDEKSIFIPQEFIKYSRCSPEQTLCHPLFYGLDAKTGYAYCADKTNSCSQISPLSNAKDLHRILESLKKMDIQQNQVVSKMDEYINEATKVCQQSEPSQKCDSLLTRRAQFNSVIVDFQAQKRGPPGKDRPRPDMAGMPEFPPEKSMAESRLNQVEEESCNWWCRNKSWASPVAIVAATLVSTVAICKYTSSTFLGICSKNKESSSADSSTTSTSSVIASPVAPTSADYTSVQ